MSVFASFVPCTRISLARPHIRLPLQPLKPAARVPFSIRIPEGLPYEGNSLWDAFPGLKAPEGLGCSVFALPAIRLAASKSKRSAALNRHSCLQLLRGVAVEGLFSVLSACRPKALQATPVQSSGEANSAWLLPRSLRCRIPKVDRKKFTGLTTEKKNLL
jgi:hypothetical protein